MNNYDKRFNNCGDNFIYAQLKYPNVMKNEFENALDFCKEKLQTSSDNSIVFLNIPADILFEKYLLKFSINNCIEYLPFEFNKYFSDILNFKQCSINSIDFYTSKADIILSIAGLHHFQPEERKQFYHECKRILKPNGVFIIGEVLKGSIQDKWLNEYVNNFNSNGHEGIFFTENEKSILESVGFKVEIEYKEYPWIFDSVESMCEYCIKLFGLNKNDCFILDNIEKYLKYTINEDGSCQFLWSLIYFKSTIFQA